VPPTSPQSPHPGRRYYPRPHFGDAARALKIETLPCDDGRVGTAHASKSSAQSVLPGVRQRHRPQVFSSVELEPLGPDLSPSPPSPVVGTVVAPIQIGAARNGVAFYSPRFELFGNWPPLSGIIFATDGGARNRRPGERHANGGIISLSWHCARSGGGRNDTTTRPEC
jgi:hypothetical protein